MKAYKVTVQATLAKTFTVYANDEEDASIAAQDLFTLDCDNPDEEKYHQDTTEIEEVTK